jgi:hypothetical protein
VNLNTYLCERTSFIRKYVLDLAKIVCEVPAASEGGLAQLLVPYLRIKVDERGLAGAHELDGNVKRYGDDILEGDESKGPGDKSVDGGVVVGPVVVEEPKSAAWVVPVFEHGVDNGAHHGHDGKDD